MAQQVKCCYLLYQLHLLLPVSPALFCIIFDLMPKGKSSDRGTLAIVLLVKKPSKMKYIFFIFIFTTCFGMSMNMIYLDKLV